MMTPVLSGWWLPSGADAFLFLFFFFFEKSLINDYNNNLDEVRAGFVMLSRVDASSHKSNHVGGGAERIDLIPPLIS